jgi:hypothetical protein
MPVDRPAGLPPARLPPRRCGHRLIPTLPITYPGVYGRWGPRACPSSTRGFGSPLLMRPDSGRAHGQQRAHAPTMPSILASDAPTFDCFPCRTLLGGSAKSKSI